MIKQNKHKNIRGQVTIFIILAIVIIAGVVGYFVFKGMQKPSTPEKQMQGAYDYYVSCLQDTARQGVKILGEQGGYIETPVFVPGSEYRPFSSQLNFLGQGVPYWMYVSGNNLLKEQMPTQKGMEKELAKYIQDRIGECDFSDFAQQGFDVAVSKENVNVGVKINANTVEISAENKIRVTFGNQTAVFGNHQTSINSKLGKFYDLAVKTYNYEKKSMFLEKYALDVMRLYAPVDGVEISCTPKVFVDENIRGDLTSALSANIAALRLKGNYYSGVDKYFISSIGEDVNEQANFLYMNSWPTRIEIYGDKVVEPVGLQQGLGILGFCYVPYHLVYDINFPVLIQFYDQNELFQFPVAVIIEKSKERNALPSAEGVNIEPEVCRYKNSDIEVYTYDSDLKPIEADITFSCFNTECRIGKTESDGRDAVFKGKVPKCVNGFILANAEGYAPVKYQISTNEEGVANLLMKKIYNLSLDLNLNEGQQALVSLESDEYSTSVLFTGSESIGVPEGYYNVSVYIFKNSSINIPASSSKQCFDIASSGVGGIFGFTQEKCVDINIPEQEIGFAVVGGGKQEEYITEEQLRDASVFKIRTEIFATPTSLQAVQDIYTKMEDSGLELSVE